MSLRLSVFNIPPNLNLDQFEQPFKELNGFKQAIYIYNNLNQPIGGIVEFTSLESADYAKKILQNFKYPNSTSGILIDFTREEPTLNPQNIYQPQPIPHQQLLQPQQGAIRPQMIQTGQPPNPLQQPANVQNSQLLVNNNPYMRGPVIPGQNPNNPNLNFSLPAQAQRNGPQPLQIDSGAMMGLYSNFLNPGFAPQQIKESSKKIFEIPPDATNCLYVDGVPIDSSEREVSHIFRPFPGYICARLIKKEAKNGRKFYYCFVDFENSMQSSIAMQTLQGYMFEAKDRKGLKIAYATPTSLIRKRKRNNSKPPLNR